MPDLSMLFPRALTPPIADGTLLVYQKLDSSLLAHLQTIFERVIYIPVDGFHLGPDAIQPTSEELSSADVLFAVQLPVTLVSIDQTPRLRFVQALSSGVGHFWAARFFKSLPNDHRLVFANSTGLQVAPIGEHVIASILLLWHRLPALIVKAHEEREWVSNSEMGSFYVREMRGSCVGVLGYGAIGREVARLCSAFGTTIVACNRTGAPTSLSPSAYHVPGTGDPHSTLPVQHYSSSSRESLHEFLARCDVVVNTLPGSPSNDELLGEAELKACKGDALIINVGRGTTISTPALVQALMATKGKEERPDAVGTLRIGGAALDVTNPEPLPRHHPLFTSPNTIITPHCSGLSTSYLARAVELLEENVGRLREGKKVVNCLRG